MSSRVDEEDFCSVVPKPGEDKQTIIVPLSH
jgi:hypothetical protein